MGRFAEEPVEHIHEKGFGGIQGPTTPYTDGAETEMFHKLSKSFGGYRMNMAGRMIIATITWMNTGKNFESLASLVGKRP
jgi:hypothetical protein